MAVATKNNRLNITCLLNPENIFRFVFILGHPQVYARASAAACHSPLSGVLASPNRIDAFCI
jgi:hypothetical protein